MLACVPPLEVKYYRDSKGRSAFLDWFDSLDDRMHQNRIMIRLDRLRKGNFGDYSSLGGGLHELRMHFGPGYRIYFGLLDKKVVLILAGGSKRSQEQDIDEVRHVWEHLKVRSK